METTLTSAPQHVSTDPATLEHQRVAAKVNQHVRDIAASALELTGGRTTYSWTGNGVRFLYQGDTAGGYGETTREYLRPDGEWGTTSPIPSESGNGLINVGLIHFVGSNDPLILAKRNIVYALMSPELDLVNFVIRNYRGQWANLQGHSDAELTRLAERLTEILEQKVLENPDAGLDIARVASGEVSAVGWMVKCLEASVYNTMRRQTQVSVNHTDWRDAYDADEYRPSQAALLAPQMRGADEQLLHQADVVITDAILAQYRQKSTSYRGGERRKLNAYTLLEHFGLPNLAVPAPAVRKAMIAQLDENPERAIQSLEAYYCLVTGAPIASHLLLSDDWLEIWRHYDEEDAARLLGLYAKQPRIVSEVVEGSLALSRPMTVAAQRNARDFLYSYSSTDETWKRLVRALIPAYSEMISTGSRDEWAKAVKDVQNHPMSPLRTESELISAIVEGYENPTLRARVAAG